MYQARMQLNRWGQSHVESDGTEDSSDVLREVLYEWDACEPIGASVGDVQSVLVGEGVGVRFPLHALAVACCVAFSYDIEN